MQTNSNRCSLTSSDIWALLKYGSLNCTNNVQLELIIDKGYEQNLKQLQSMIKHMDN